MKFLKYSREYSDEKDLSGFSMVELLVTIIVAGILVLTVGVLSEIANTGHQKASRTHAVYNDASYAFKLIRNKARASESIRVDPGPPAPWIGSRLLIKNEKVSGGVVTFPEAAFGVYPVSGVTNDLIQVPDIALAFDCSTVTNCERILSVPSSETLNMSLSWPCSCSGTCTDSCLSVCTATGGSCPCTTGPDGICPSEPDYVNVQLSGSKNKISFDVVNAITRRMP